MFAYIVRRLVAGSSLLIVMSIVTFALFFASPSTRPFACGKNCSAPRRRRPPRRRSATTTPVVQWTDFVKGIFAGRDYPDDPELQREGPRDHRPLRRSLPGLLAATPDGQRPDQGRLPGLDLAGDRRVHPVDHRRRAVRADRRREARAPPRPRHRRLRAGRLRLPDLLRRPPALIRRHQVGLVAVPALRHHRRRRIRRLAHSLLLPGDDAGAVLHGRLRPDDPRLRARVDERGLRPHRPAKGLSPRKCSSSTPCAPRSPRSSRCSASTSPACSAARSSPSRSSASTASASSRSRPTSPTTCRS